MGVKGAIKKMSRLIVPFCCISLCCVLAISSIPIPLNFLFLKRTTEEYWIEVNRRNEGIVILEKEEVKQLIDKSQETFVQFYGFFNMKSMQRFDTLYVYRIDANTEKSNTNVIALALDEDGYLKIVHLPDCSKGCIYTLVGESGEEFARLLKSVF